jgi:hypothetical protein
MLNIGAFERKQRRNGDSYSDLICGKIYRFKTSTRYGLGILRNVVVAKMVNTKTSLYAKAGTCSSVIPKTVMWHVMGLGSYYEHASACGGVGAVMFTY